MKYYIICLILLVSCTENPSTNKKQKSSETKENTIPGWIAGITVNGMSKHESQESVSVKNFDELMKAIGPDKYIMLYCDSMTIPGSNYSNKNKYVKYRDGWQINGVKNLTIISKAKTFTKLIQPDKTSKVLSFWKCRNITLAGITAGHAPNKGGCTASVIDLFQDTGVAILSCDFFGCGYSGITANQTSNFVMSYSTIRECSGSIMEIIYSNKYSFHNCEFINNNKPNGAGTVFIAHVDSLAFSDCVFNNNEAQLKKPLFEVLDSDDLYLINSDITKNTASVFSSYPDDLMLIKTNIEENSWQGK